MRSKKILYISLLGVLFISLSSLLVLADNGGSKNNIVPHYGNQEELAAIEAKLSKYKELKAKKQSLTEEQKAYESKLKAIREDIWRDIEDTHNIDTDGYLVLEFSQFSTFFKGEIEGFSDKEFLKQIQPFINKHYFNLSTGSSRPFVLIKKDLSEVAVAYKDNNSNNVLFTEKKQESEWAETKEVKKGKAKLSVKDIK